MTLITFLIPNAPQNRRRLNPPLSTSSSSVRKHLSNIPPLLLLVKTRLLQRLQASIPRLPSSLRPTLPSPFATTTTTTTSLTLNPRAASDTVAAASVLAGHSNSNPPRLHLLRPQAPNRKNNSTKRTKDVRFCSPSLKTLIRVENGAMGG
jgi:hypothetical protein